MDRNVVLGWIRDEIVKDRTDKPSPDFAVTTEEVFQLLQRWLEGEKLNLAAGWLLDQYDRINPNPPVKGIEPGAVVEVQLGSPYGSEHAFPHPCLILQRHETILSVVPLSSQKHHQGKGIVIEGDEVVHREGASLLHVEFQMDGEPDKSVALIWQLRTVSVLRVRQVWRSKPSDRVVRVIQDHITKFTALEVWRELNKVRNAHKKILDRFDAAKDKNTELRADNERLKLENNVLKDQLQELISLSEEVSRVTREKAALEEDYRSALALLDEAAEKLRSTS